VCRGLQPDRRRPDFSRVAGAARLSRVQEVRMAIVARQGPEGGGFWATPAVTRCASLAPTIADSTRVAIDEWRSFERWGTGSLDPYVSARWVATGDRRLWRGSGARATVKIVT
jgi:hypothetical protein